MCIQGKFPSGKIKSYLNLSYLILYAAVVSLYANNHLHQQKHFTPEMCYFPSQLDKYDIATQVFEWLWQTSL